MKPNYAVVEQYEVLKKLHQSNYGAVKPKNNNLISKISLLRKKHLLFKEPHFNQTLLTVLICQTICNLKYIANYAAFRFQSKVLNYR